jgi:hypothetical protein
MLHVTRACGTAELRPCFHSHVDARAAYTTIHPNTSQILVFLVFILSQLIKLDKSNTKSTNIYDTNIFFMTNLFGNIKG